MDVSLLPTVSAREIFRAGTGLLPIVISPLVHQYTVTDLEVQLPLIRKNLTLIVPSWKSDKKIVVELYVNPI
jgi:hypothetical protein